MKNVDQWVTTKYVLDRKGNLRASRDPAEVFVGSKLKANITADLFGKHIPQFAKGDLLDLGCGKVPLYVLYRDLVTSVTCVDWNTNPHLDLAQDLTQPLPFPDGSFDTIILSDVLEHIPEPEVTVREMHRILRPGGHVLITVPFFYWLHEEPHDYYRYTRHALQRFAENQGFEIVVLEASGGALEILTDVIAKNLVFHVKKHGVQLANCLQTLHLHLLQTSFGRKVRDRTSKQFPIEYFLVLRK